MIDYRGSNAIARFSLLMDGGEESGKRSSPKLFVLRPEGNVPHPENMVRKASAEGLVQRANIWLCWMPSCTSRLVKHRGTGLHIHWMEWKCLLGITELNPSGNYTAPYRGQPWPISVTTNLHIPEGKHSTEPKVGNCSPSPHCPVVHLQNDLRGTSETRAEVINCF